MPEPRGCPVDRARRCAVLAARQQQPRGRHDQHGTHRGRLCSAERGPQGLGQPVEGGSPVSESSKPGVEGCGCVLLARPESVALTTSCSSRACSRAASRASRVEKCRYSGPAPKPTRSAMASREPLVPCLEKYCSATSRMWLRLCCLTERGRRPAPVTTCVLFATSWLPRLTKRNASPYGCQSDTDSTSGLAPELDPGRRPAPPPSPPSIAASRRPSGPTHPPSSPSPRAAS